MCRDLERQRTEARAANRQSAGFVPELGARPLVLRRRETARGRDSAGRRAARGQGAGQGAGAPADPRLGRRRGGEGAGQGGADSSPKAWRPGGLWDEEEEG